MAIKHTPKAPAVALKNSAEEPHTPVPPPVAPKGSTLEALTQPTASAPSFLQQLAGLSDEHLKAAVVAIRDEVRRRRDSAESNRPQRGARFVITAAGRHQGKRATVVISKATSAYVDVEGVPRPVLVKRADLRPLTDEESAK